jgi:hypothetical protein
MRVSGHLSFDARRLLAAAALVTVIACARMGSPQGGPQDKVPPKLLGTIPESLGVYPDWHHDAEFRFDEVVSEGGTPSQGLGTGDLERLILLSPTKGIPVIHWKRDRITVRPREGWKPNRTYRLELLPGLQDLRRNKSDTTAVLTFSTGGTLPTDTLSGLVIDWVQGQVARGALVEMILQPDSLVYRATSDSSGRYVVGPLPAGNWQIFGVLDQNRNLRRDRRESYDSTLLAMGAHRAAPLWLIPRDTLGPKLQAIVPTDSVSATLTFSQPLDPTQRFDSLDVTFRRQKDSVPVPFRSLRPKALDDSLQKLVQARLDSIRQAADTTHRDTTTHKPPPQAPVQPPPGARPGGRPPSAPKVDAEADSIIKSRPVLFDRLVLRVDSAFTPEARYEVVISGIRSAAGVTGEARSTLVIPKAKPPAPADTLRAPSDSTRSPTDTTTSKTPAKKTSP